MIFYRFNWYENNPELLTHGKSTWYVQVEENMIVKQVTIYESGLKIKYDDNHFEDDFGGLGTVDKFVKSEYDDCQEISGDIFASIWT